MTELEQIRLLLDNTRGTVERMLIASGERLIARGFGDDAKVLARLAVELRKQLGLPPASGDPVLDGLTAEVEPRCQIKGCQASGPFFVPTFVLLPMGVRRPAPPGAELRMTTTLATCAAHRDSEAPARMFRSPAFHNFVRQDMARRGLTKPADFQNMTWEWTPYEGSLMDAVVVDSARKARREAN